MENRPGTPFSEGRFGPFIIRLELFAMGAKVRQRRRWGGQLQHEHCVAVDIRWELPKILPRLIQIETIQQRRVLLAAGKAFAGAEPNIEGNLRQRRYRFDKATTWLQETFKAQAEAELA